MRPDTEARARSQAILDLFRPSSVAVVGASADRGKFGARIIPILLRQGFRGEVYPINAKRDEVDGFKAYPDVGSVPGPVDCVVFCIASRFIEPVLKDCEAKGVKLLVITSAGFGESGSEEGQRLQRAVEDFARRSGTRVIGPNGIGFANFVDRVSVSAAAALAWDGIPTGHIGLATQSGGLGLASMIYQALEEGISFSHIVSTGNEADLGAVEFARALVHDEATQVIALTLEAVRDGPAFLTLLQEAAAAQKPVVILKSGRSELGSTMAASHTGAMAGSAAVFEAICRQSGVVLANDLDELFQFAQMLAKLRLAGKLPAQDGRRPGRGTVAFSVSGGHVGLFADLGSLAGLEFPPLAEETRQRLAKELGGSSEMLNPIDLTGGMVTDHTIWERCLAVLLEDPAVEVAVPIITVAQNYDPALRGMIAVAETSPKPVFVLWAGGSFEGEGKPLLQKSHLPLFATPARTVAAIRALDRYCAGRPPALPAASPETAGEARASLERAVGEGRSALGEAEAKALLSGLGLPVTREALVRSAEEAAAAAREIGYPVALKGQHPKILHKSEANVIALGVADEAALRAAYDRILGAMERHAGSDPAMALLVQEMVPQGVELILGTSRDPIFGPMAMFGLGGIFVEVFEDVALLLPPFDRSQARAAIESTRAVRLLQGARGRAPLDLDRLADLMVTLGTFAYENRDLVQEIDINPLVALDRADDPLRALDALIVLRKD